MATAIRDVAAVWRRAGTSPRLLATLAEADAFAGLGLTRREALWQVAAIGGGAPLPLFAGLEGEADEAPVALPPMTLGEEIVADYTALRLTLRAHPMALLRPRLTPAPKRRRSLPPLMLRRQHRAENAAPLLRKPLHYRPQLEGSHDKSTSLTGS